MLESLRSPARQLRGVGRRVKGFAAAVKHAPQTPPPPPQGEQGPPGGGGAPARQLRGVGRRVKGFAALVKLAPQPLRRQVQVEQVHRADGDFHPGHGGVDIAFLVHRLLPGTIQQSSRGSSAPPCWIVRRNSVVTLLALPYPVVIRYSPAAWTRKITPVPPWTLPTA